jgi:isoleucyl-tRNA synthetase
MKNIIYKEIESKIKSGDLKRTNEASVTAKINSPFLKSLDFKKLLMIGKFHEGKDLEVTGFDSAKCQRC